MELLERDGRGSAKTLVVANDGVGESDVAALVQEDAGTLPSEVLVVAPALNRFLGRAVAEPDAARRDAEWRATRTVLSLSATGVRSSGTVGDPDPLFAIEDALAVFDADSVVIAVTPNRSEGWLGEKLVQRARARFAVPVRLAVVAPSGYPHPIAA